MTIATVIITYNEANNIAKCIESVLSFSDVIIVLDSFSEDNTIEIASNYPQVKVFQRVFDNYISQKNYANQLVESHYIFSLDADEWASDELQLFLKNHKNDLPKIASFPRVNKIGDQSILFGTWFPDRKERLWQKNTAKWAGTIPHEHLEFDTSIAVEKLPFPIIHQAYQTVDELKIKSQKYATLAAQGLSRKSWLSILISLAFSPYIKFIKGYVIKKGFLNGNIGFLIEMTIFVETFSKYFLAAKIKLGIK